MAEEKMILVTGDVVLDHNVYEGGRMEPNAPPGNGSYYEPIPGGAMLIYRLLNALDPNCVRFGIAQTTPELLQPWPSQFHAKALWHAVNNLDKKTEQHWALEKYLGYGVLEAGDYPGKPAPGLKEIKPRILVLDDGGLGFREAEGCWPPILTNERPEGLEWIILKMSRPLACGKLWSRLMRDSWRKRLIVIVSADQLRREGLLVAGGLSWETTVDDIVEELESNHALRALEQCRHLIVTMRSDAALWLDQPGGDKDAHCQLVFDRTCCEGEWQETNKDCQAYGYQSTITASIAWRLATAVREKEEDPGNDKKPPVDEADLTVALTTGLSTMRLLLKKGHGPVEKPPVFPFAEAAGHLKVKAEMNGKKPEFAFTSAEVRCRDGRCQIGGPKLDPGEWTILGLISPWHITHNKVPLEPARRVALLGPDKLPGVPCATFGKLQTFDRWEIDSLRSIRRLMLMYRDSTVRNQSPLCLGVFGAPGAGKSFGLKQIATGVFGDKTPVPEFNLSQLKDTDLVGAFHQVRDKVLTGETPVVFWDEFDTNKFEWLKYFLAPMQDGSFQEGQATHSVGKAVFIFAGGTSYSFEEFNNHRDDPDFKLKKGPDFISRLSGYLDIAGPNKREDKKNKGKSNTAQPGLLSDREYPVRRAMLIRSTLELGDKPLQIERGLLTAILSVSRYRNGARSLTKLVSYIRDRGGLPLRRAYLPPDDILALYVEDVEEFHRITRKYAEFYAQADQIAKNIHDDYLKSLDNLSPAERAEKPNDKPWEQITQGIKDSNVAAALRLPNILELASLTLAEGEGSSADVDKILAENLEIMAEAEHGGWEEQKRIDGWTYSPHRNDDALLHDLLIPYELLTEKVKEYDRETIRKYHDYAQDAGYKIVLSPKPATP